MLKGVQVLISHNQRFIYLKTIKTASTSTEVLFQVFCIPPKQIPHEWEEWHATDEVVSEYGVVGERINSAENSRYFNHMSAQQVISAVGRDLWSSYFKFANVRNPWDKIVSHFFYYQAWTGADNHRSDLNQAFEAFVDSYQKRPVEALLCKKEFAMDAYIRYENLQDDIADVASRLSVVLPQLNIPKLKTGQRPEDFADYRSLYGSQERLKVERLYNDWIEKFGYRF